MRIVDRDHVTISNYTESMGELVPAVVIKEDATPIDDITKFAWADDDYEQVMMCIPTEEQIPVEANPQDDIESMLVDQEYRLTILELGIGDDVYAL